MKRGLHMNERGRAIQKSISKQRGQMEGNYYYFMKLRAVKRCVVCGAITRRYSEYSQTGYEIEECKNGCWKHETIGIEDVLTTNGFHFEGKLSDKEIFEFLKQLKKNRIRHKKDTQLFWKKKKSQRKRLKKKA